LNEQDRTKYIRQIDSQTKKIEKLRLVASTDVSDSETIILLNRLDRSYHKITSLSTALSTVKKEANLEMVRSDLYETRRKLKRTLSKLVMSVSPYKKKPYSDLSQRQKFRRVKELQYIMEEDTYSDTLQK